MKQKKNIIIPVIYALILCVLCGLCLTSAKYTTSQTKANPETGRVAKWGVTIDTSTFGAFATSYTNDTITIMASDNGTDKIFAPGASGTFAKVTLGGSPEVRVKVSYDLSFSFSGWTINTSEEYMPIAFTIDGTEYKIDSTYPTIADLKNKLNTVADFSKTFEPGTDLSTVTPTTISWAWAYTGVNLDADDTALANLSTSPTLSISVTANVTQVNS